MKKVKLIAARRFDGQEGKVRRGQTLEVGEFRAQELIRAGLAAPPGEDAQPTGQGELVDGVGDAAGQVLTPEAQQAAAAEKLRADQDQVLEPYKRGGGWFHFGEGDALVKVQGREDALAELKRRTAPQ